MLKERSEAQRQESPEEERERSLLGARETRETKQTGRQKTEPEETLEKRTETVLNFAPAGIVWNSGRSANRSQTTRTFSVRCQ